MKFLVGSVFLMLFLATPVLAGQEIEANPTPPGYLGGGGGPSGTTLKNLPNSPPLSVPGTEVPDSKPPKNPNGDVPPSGTPLITPPQRV